MWPKSQNKTLNILRTKTALKMKSIFHNFESPTLNLIHLVCFHTWVAPSYTKDYNRTNKKQKSFLSNSPLTGKLVLYLFHVKKHTLLTYFFASILFWECLFLCFFQPETKKKLVLKLIFTTCMSNSNFQRHSSCIKGIHKRNNFPGSLSCEFPAITLAWCFTYKSMFQKHRQGIEDSKCKKSFLVII